MSKKKVVAEVVTRDVTGMKNSLARVWVTTAVARELGLVARKDWLYLCKDWMGVLSTQCLVEDFVDEEGYRVYVSPDRMRDAHFKDGDKPKVWKITEWE